jgi:hypothetical protein
MSEEESKKTISNADFIKQKFAEHQQKKNPGKAAVAVDEFEWIQLNQELAETRLVGESQKEKLIRKVSENPWVPLGTLLTIGFLGRGMFAFMRRDMSRSQYMMRGRIAAQGFTVVGLMMGIVWNLRKDRAEKNSKLTEVAAQIPVSTPTAP